MGSLTLPEGDEGLLEKTQRILPEDVDLVFRRGTWDVPAVIFPWLARLGDIGVSEMDHVFNMDWD